MPTVEQSGRSCEVPSQAHVELIAAMDRADAEIAPDGQLGLHQNSQVGGRGSGLSAKRPVDSENIAELESLIGAERGGKRVLDLKDVTPAGQDGRQFFSPGAKRLVLD